MTDTHLIDLHKVSDRDGPDGAIAALSYKAPDQAYRTRVYGDDMEAQSAALEMREGLIASGKTVEIRNFL